jgi:putative membrane protein
MLVRDHKNVRQQGRDLAKKLGVAPTPPAGDQSAKDRGRDEATTRFAWRRVRPSFLQHEVAFHKGVIDAVTTTLLPAIQMPAQALVVKVAPAFQAHMLAADNLDKKLATK